MRGCFACFWILADGPARFVDYLPAKPCFCYPAMCSQPDTPASGVLSTWAYNLVAVPMIALLQGIYFHRNVPPPDESNVRNLCKILLHVNS